MFKLSFTLKDLIRAGWAFLGGVVAYLAVNQAAISNGTVDGKALLTGAVVAGVVSLKNLLLADGTTAKG